MKQRQQGGRQLGPRASKIGFASASFALGLASLLLLPACEESPPGTQGELGQGSFTYKCVSSEDVGCLNAPYDGAELPGGIAVGSKFDLNFHGEESARIVSGSESLAETLSDGFLARAPGAVAMLAQATAQDRVVDFVHLELTDVADLELRGEGTDGEEPLSVGSNWEWSASPKSSEGTALAGTLLCKWASSDTSVVRFSQTQETHLNGVRGIAPGKAVVTVTVGSASKAIEVTVE
jgi:hypothetical protein